MSLTTKKLSGFLVGVLVLMVAIWGISETQSQAASVPSAVLVAVCGDGEIQAPVEECDDGKQCQNLETCSADIDCVGIGDDLCKPRPGGGCEANCLLPTGGGGGGEPQTVVISEITAFPEQRSGSLGSNYDTDFFYRVLSPDNEVHTVLYESSIRSSNNAGVAAIGQELFTVSQGLYDVSFKSESHLTRILDSVFLQNGDNYLNFTNSTNSTSIGSIRLIAGDINGFGSSPSTYGDDVINAVDLSLLLSKIGLNDPSGNGIRANLNQDNIVNQTDLSILLSNLDLEGDK